jgi:transposase-like protein
MGVMAKRKRRAFSREFKSQTVRLVLENVRGIPEVARELAADSPSAFGACAR